MRDLIEAARDLARQPARVILSEIGAAVALVLLLGTLLVALPLAGP